MDLACDNHTHTHTLSVLWPGLCTHSPCLLVVMLVRFCHVSYVLSCWLCFVMLVLVDCCCVLSSLHLLPVPSLVALLSSSNQFSQFALMFLPPQLILMCPDYSFVYILSLSVCSSCRIIVVCYPFPARYFGSSVFWEVLYLCCSSCAPLWLILSLTL